MWPRKIGNTFDGYLPRKALKALLLLSIIVASSASAATVSIPDSMGMAGSSVEIPINVDDTNDVTGFQFTITFDPNRLEATGAIVGSSTSEWSIVANTDIPGEIKISGLDYSLIGLAGGSGSLCIMQLDIKASAGNTDSVLDLSGCKLVDNLAQEIPTISQSGTVTVTSPPLGLVGYWKMEDDPADGVMDSSQYDNDGKVDGNSSPTSLADGTYEFDGVDDCIIVPDSESLDVDKVTLSAWIYVDRYKNDQRIISKEKGKRQPYSIYTLLLSGKGEKRLQMRLGLKGVRKRKTVTSTSKIPRNKWVHVAATFNGKKVRLYINGKLKRSVGVSGTVRKLRHNNQPVYIGDSQFYNRCFDGKIDEVRIYRRALKASQIRKLYRQGRN